jgi:tRNA dimethylallyltransferase
VEETGELTKLVVILGPTASGKTELAVRLAERCAGEIVNADSMQVYSGMDIGTAKPSPEFRQRVPHHLIDIVTPDVNFTAADFRREAGRVIADILGRGKRVIVAGGTGLYIKVLLQGLADSPGGDEGCRDQLKAVAREQGNGELLRQLAEVDPETARRLHPNDQVRIIRALEVYRQSGIPISSYRDGHGFAGSRYHALKIGVKVERDELYRRIEQRVEGMIEAGLADEVAGLMAAGYGPDMKALRSIGYKEMCACLAGSCTLDEAVALIKRDSRRYAKRQMTWFAREPEIKWLDYPASFATICSHVIEFLA